MDYTNPDLNPLRLTLNQVKTLPPYPDTEVVIPEGHGWLEGDAPFDSEDSNHFGPVGGRLSSRAGYT